MGWAFTGIGIGLITTGLILVATGPQTEEKCVFTTTSPSCETVESTKLRDTGFIVMIGGLVSGALGLLLLSTNSSSVSINGTEIAIKPWRGRPIALTPRGIVF